MEKNLKRGAALCLSLLLSGEPGAAVFAPAALPPGSAHLLPAAALAPAPLARDVETHSGAAPRTLVLAPIVPEAPSVKASPEAVEAPAPSALPADARAPRKARLTGGLLRATPGVAAALLKDQGARDGFRMMRVADSEGFMLEYNAPVPQAVDPLVIDLNGDGLRTRPGRVVFDIDADGKRDSVSDIAKGDGLLVFDADGDGRSGQNGGELFGDAARLGGGGGGKISDGFQALEALIVRAVEDGLIGPEAGLRNSLSREDLAALEDAWGLRVRIGGFRGRDRRLTDIGIVRLDFGAASGTRHEDFDGRGNALSVADGAQVVMLDGSRRAYGELWLRKKAGTLMPVAR